MMLQLVWKIAALAAMIGASSGCAPEPTPSPSPSGFTAEKEAFAAAAATYRAYAEALNGVDLSDPATFEPVYAWTTGTANATDRKGLSAYHADGANVSGTTTPTLIELASFESSSGVISLATCLDVSTVDVRSAEGMSLVEPDRVDVQRLLITLTPNPASQTGLLIQNIGPREGEPLCIS